jgi:dethiobiotin synthetase
MKSKVYFVTGIDTGIGKTYATGMLSRALLRAGKKSVTQKMVQTGCEDMAEDLVQHRQLEGRDLLDVDKDYTTAPYIYHYPCSPHMAAEMEHRPIDLDVVTAATQKLAQEYEYVLVEGAGGLMVPLSLDTMSIDYAKANHYPVILVTSGRLGSINHTVLSLHACRTYGIPVKAVVFNLYPVLDELITQNTLTYMRQYLAKEFPETAFLMLPEAGTDEVQGIEAIF